MRILARVFGFLLVISLALAALSWAVASTLLDSGNLQNVLQRAQLPKLTASVVPGFLSAHAEDPTAAKKALDKLITPQLISDQINSLVPQVVAHLKSGQQIFVDLRDIGQMAIGAGAPTPADKSKSPLFTPQPVALGGIDEPLMTSAKIVLALQWIAPLTALLLAILILITGGHARLKLLAKPLLGAAILTGVLAAGVWLPVLVTSLVAGGGQAKELEPIVRAATSAIAAAQFAWLITATAAYAALAIILYILSPILGALGNHHKKEAKA